MRIVGVVFSILSMLASGGCVWVAVSTSRPDDPVHTQTFNAMMLALVMGLIAIGWMTAAVAFRPRDRMVTAAAPAAQPYPAAPGAEQAPAGYSGFPPAPQRPAPGPSGGRQQPPGPPAPDHRAPVPAGYAQPAPGSAPPGGRPAAEVGWPGPNDQPTQQSRPPT